MDGAAVSDDDALCRFFPRHLMDENDGLPSPDAFRASNRELSVYHVGQVEKSSSLVALCFGTLTGNGEAVLTAGEFKEVAQRVLDRPERPKGAKDDLTGLMYRPANFPVPEVVWRPNRVSAGREAWRDAHVHVETTSGNEKFPLGYRATLAMECRVLRLPDPIEEEQDRTAW